MLNPHIAQKVIDQGLSLGANFCDLFVEKSFSQNITILDQKLEEIQGGVEFGVGVRLVFGNKVLYGYTNKANEEELLHIVKTLGEGDRREAQAESQVFNFIKTEDQHPATKGLQSEIPVKHKVDYLLTGDRAAREFSTLVKQVNFKALQRMQQVEIFNSHGLHASDERNYTRLAMSVIAEDKGEQANGYDGPGMMRGWEFAETLDPKELGKSVAELAITKLTAGSCPSGKLPVIIGNGFGGVIFHEACGHLLETTSVEKKASVFWDKMGEEIASPCVSAVDDGTWGNYWGSINIDDEGMPTQKTQLIKNGVLNSFLVDYVGHLKTGYERTGSGRRQSYKFAPASRMRNTFIEAGNDSLEDMIASVDEGIYCKKMENLIFPPKKVI
jgi:TldD protein